jgi:hypothetical protein
VGPVIPLNMRETMTDLEQLKILLNAIAKTNLRFNATIIGSEDDYEIFVTYEDVVAENSNGLEVLSVPKEDYAD